MNFVGIILQLLITGIFYIRGFCPFPKIEYTIRLSSVDLLDTLTHDPLGHYSAPYLQKFENEDLYYMHDIDDRTLREIVSQSDLFPSEQLEFVSMYELDMIFLFRNAHGLVYVMCQFSNKGDIQKFIASVNSEKPKGNSIKVRKIARYTIDDAPYSVPRIESFAGEAELSVRRLANFADAEGKAFYISHTTSNDTDEKIEADLIFVSTKCSFSALLSGNTIALCVKNIPAVRFIIRFSDGENVEGFVSDYILGRVSSDEKCVFPFLTFEQINSYL